MYMAKPDGPLYNLNLHKIQTKENQMLIEIKKKVMEVLKSIIDKVEFDKIFEHMGKLQI